MMEVRGDQLYTLCLCSVRYALGRRTYIVDDVCQIVKQAIPNLTPANCSVILRDIREQEERQLLGDPCDIARWVDLRKALQEKAEG